MARKKISSRHRLDPGMNIQRKCWGLGITRRRFYMSGLCFYCNLMFSNTLKSAWHINCFHLKGQFPKEMKYICLHSPFVHLSDSRASVKKENFWREISWCEPNRYLLCLTSWLASAGCSGLVTKYINACQGHREPEGGVRDQRAQNGTGSVSSSPAASLPDISE